MPTRTLIIATGTQYRGLSSIDSLSRFEGAGVYYSATTIESRLCPGAEAIVVASAVGEGSIAVSFIHSTLAEPRPS